MKVEVKREKESNRIAGVIEWREVLVQTKKKHPVWWGREKVGGDPSCETIYCLDDWRFNFIIFNELSRHNETTTTTTTTRKRRRDFLRSPFILSCASFSILTRTDTGQQPSQPRVVFFLHKGESCWED
jgi:hypothetical protein